MKQVCAHTDEGQEACYECKNPMTKMVVSTFGGFNKLVNNVSLFIFRSNDEELLLAFRNTMN